MYRTYSSLGTEVNPLDKRVVNNNANNNPNPNSNNISVNTNPVLLHSSLEGGGGGGVVELQNAQHKQDFIKSSKIACIDIYAEWCQPCKRATPAFLSLANEVLSKRNDIKFAKEDLDRGLSPGLQSVPFFQIFKNGQMVDSVVGANMDELVKKLNMLFEQVDGEKNMYQSGPNLYSKNSIRQTQNQNY